MTEYQMKWVNNICLGRYVPDFRFISDLFQRSNG